MSYTTYATNVEGMDYLELKEASKENRKKRLGRRSKLEMGIEDGK